MKAGISDRFASGVYQVVWIIKDSSDPTVFESLQNWSFEIIDPCQVGYILAEMTLLDASTEITGQDDAYDLIGSLTYRFDQSPQFATTTYDVSDAASSPCGGAGAQSYVWSASPADAVTSDDFGKVIADWATPIPASDEDAYPVTITITDIVFDDNGQSLISESVEAKVMMGDCENVLSRAITFASTDITVYKELEPHFTIPADTDLYSFGTGGQCGGTLTVTSSASPEAFTGLDTSTRIVTFADKDSLPAQVSLTITASWVNA